MKLFFKEQKDARGDGMTIEAVLRNDKALAGEQGGRPLEEKVALGRSVKERRVGHRLVSVKLVDTKKTAPRRTQKFGSWQGTSDAPIQTDTMGIEQTAHVTCDRQVQRQSPQGAADRCQEGLLNSECRRTCSLNFLRMLAHRQTKLAVGADQGRQRMKPTTKTSWRKLASEDGRCKFEVSGGTHESVVRGASTRGCAHWPPDDREAALPSRGGIRAKRTRCIESLLEALGLKEDSKSLTTPGTMDADRDDDPLPKIPSMPATMITGSFFEAIIANWIAGTITGLFLEGPF